MTRKEFLSSLENQGIDFKIIKEIEHKYGFEIPKIVQKIISASVESVFFDDDGSERKVACHYPVKGRIHGDI